MTFLRSALLKGAMVAAVVGGTMVATAASADVACNRFHECWHVHDRLTYPTGLGIIFHGDTWHGRGYHWRRDRADHGYYRNGVWIGF
ncbi:MAG TPA: hypothetical protein VHW60_09160 [Caulobacteraceae bacterium]|nr:hypothetical protein [Caulobacteraceae bacterium]